MPEILKWAIENWSTILMVLAALIAPSPNFPAIFEMLKKLVPGNKPAPIPPTTVPVPFQPNTNTLDLILSLVKLFSEGRDREGKEAALAALDRYEAIVSEVPANPAK
jgi:hypothetical protein